MASENPHTDNGQHPAHQPHGADGPPLPSRRLTALLAAVMLGIGLAVGAAIGPAPVPSFGIDAPLSALLRSLLAEHPSHHAKAHPSSNNSSSAPTTPHTSTPGETAPETETTPTEEETPREKKPATKKGSGGAPLPPINRVWLVELSGTGFSEALANPSTAPYIDQQAVKAGSLLSGWSAQAGSSFATLVPQIATTEPALVQTVIQPVCNAGEECLPETPGALAAANAFLAKTLPKLMSNAAYRSNGLIVVTFGTVAAGAESELPTGSTTSLLASQPAAGALLISPYVAAGKRPGTKFDPAAPRTSMEALLRR